MLRGFSVEHIQQANGVPLAVEPVYGERLDVIILDFFLDEMDGADFAKLIPHNENCCNRQVPILLITGRPDHHKVLKLLEAGTNGMLAKPIVPKDLYHRPYTILLARPKPFAITKDYVGPMRNRQKPPVTKRLLRPAAFKMTVTGARRPLRRNPVFEDGILF